MEPPSYSIIKAEFGEEEETARGAAERRSIDDELVAPICQSIIKACEILDEEITTGYHHHHRHHHNHRQYHEERKAAKQRRGMMEPPSYSVIKAEFGEQTRVGRSGRVDEIPSQSIIKACEYADNHEKTGKRYGRPMDPPSYSIIKAEFGGDGRTNDEKKDKRKSGTNSSMQPPTYSIIKAEFGDDDISQKAEQNNCRCIMQQPPSYSVIKAEFGNETKARKRSSTKEPPATSSTASIIKACEIVDQSSAAQTSQHSHIITSSSRSDGALKPTRKNRGIVYYAFRCCFRSEGTVDTYSGE